MAISAIGCPMIEKNKPSHLHVSKPKAGWLLLPTAVFRFGVADEADAIANNSSNNKVMEATVMSLPQLHAILKEASGATRVEIDPAQCTFVFQFSHRGSTWGGPPWGLLENIDQARPSSDPRADAEALFNKVGLVRVGDEEAAIGLREHGAVRRATGLVWRHYMLREFDRALRRTKSPCLRVSVVRLHPLKRSRQTSGHCSPSLIGKTRLRAILRA